MEISTIIGIVTIIVTYVLGLLSKKSQFISNKLIPLQNLIIGLISTLICYIITKDFNLSIAGIGLFTGGTYDLIENMKLIANPIEVGEEEGGNEND